MKKQRTQEYIFTNDYFIDKISVGIECMYESKKQKVRRG